MLGPRVQACQAGLVKGALEALGALGASASVAAGVDPSGMIRGLSEAGKWRAVGRSRVCSTRRPSIDATAGTAADARACATLATVVAAVAAVVSVFAEGAIAVDAVAEEAVAEEAVAEAGVTEDAIALGSAGGARSASVATVTVADSGVS